MLKHFLPAERLGRISTVLLLTGLLSGCGPQGSADSPASLPEVTAPAAGLKPAATGRSVKLVSLPPRITPAADLAALRAEAEALPVPAGVDPQLFGELREAMLAAVGQDAARSVSKLPSGEGNLVSDLHLEEQGSRGTLGWTYVNIGDYDLNGEVGISDITPIGIHFNKSEASSDWDSARVADGDGNGLVSISDITPLGVHFGASVQGYNIYGRLSGGSGYSLLGSVPVASGSGTPKQLQFPLASIDYDIYMVAPYDSFGEDMPQQELLNPMALPLDPAVVQVDSFDDDGVLLSGDVGNIEVGSVIVSTEGRGLLRRVEGITPVAGGAQLATSQATLEDLFDYVSFGDQLQFSFDDVESFEPEIEGLTFEEDDSGAGTSSARSGSASTGIIKLSVSYKPHDNLLLNGTISMDAGADLAVDIGTGWSDFGQLNTFEFNAWADGKISGTVKALREFKLAEGKLKLGTLHLAPVWMPAGPIPVVVTPEIQVWLKFTGKGDVAIQATTSGTAHVSVATKYDRLRSWSADFDSDLQWGESPAPVLSGTITGEFSIFGPEMDLFIYGVIGPYLHLELPYASVSASINDKFIPPDSFDYSLTIGASFGARGSVGVEVAALSGTIARFDTGNILNVSKPLYSATYPLSGASVSGKVLSAVPYLTDGNQDLGEDEYILLDWVPEALVEFMQGGKVVASCLHQNNSPSLRYSSYSRFLAPGTYQIRATAEGYLEGKGEVIVTDKVAAYSQNIYVYPHADSESVDISISSPAAGQVIHEPMLVLEGVATAGEKPFDGLLLDFLPDKAGGLYDGTGNFGVGAIEPNPDGSFAIPVKLDSDVQSLLVVPYYEFFFGPGDSQSLLVPLKTNLPDGFPLDCDFEPAAMLGVLSWKLDAVYSDGTQEPDIPGVPNEDFRLVVIEPGHALVAGQEQDGLGYIRQVPGSWHWYYYLPQSAAQSGDIIYPKVHLLSSTHDGGPFSYSAYFQVSFYSEVYTSLDHYFASGSLKNAQGITPIDPFGTGFDWLSTLGLTIP